MITELDKREAMIAAVHGVIVSLEQAAGHLRMLSAALTKSSEAAQQTAPAPAPPPPLATVTPITPTDTPVELAPEPAQPAMTLDELKAQLQDIAAKLQPPETGFAQLSAMLQQFGVDRVSALKPEQYGEALVAATALLEQQVSS